MHILIAILYGFTVYIACIAYSLIARPDMIVVVVLGGPVIICGSISVLLALDLAITRIRSIWA